MLCMLCMLCFVKDMCERSKAMLGVIMQILGTFITG